MVKIGDKLEVMVDFPNISYPSKGSVIAVTAIKATNPDIFYVFNPNNPYGPWFFDIRQITIGELKLLTQTVTLPNVTYVPQVSNATQPVQFKVGDVVEWSTSSLQWEIIADKGNDFEIKLVKEYIYLPVYKIGDVLLHHKNNFSTATLVNQTAQTFTAPKGGTLTITVSKSLTVDDIELINPGIPYVNGDVCECGKEKHGFASHSQWCPKHERNNLMP